MMAKSFHTLPIHYSLIIQSFGTIEYELLTALLKKKAILNKLIKIKTPHYFYKELIRPNWGKEIPLD